MPGLLQSPEGKFGSAKVVYAFIAEFLGTLLFTFAGTATPVGSTSTQKGTDTGAGQTAAANWAPWCVCSCQELKCHLLFQLSAQSLAIMTCAAGEMECLWQSWVNSLQLPFCSWPRNVDT